MSELIRHSEIPQYRASHQEPGYFAYTIHTADREFATYFGSPGYRALAWQANINFTYLHQVALEELPKKVRGDEDRRDYPSTPEPAQVTATFILQTEDDPDLVELYLGEEEALARYQALVSKEPHTITFARYDIRRLDPNLLQQEYTFTAVNPRYTVERKPELGLQLPLTTPFSLRALRWVAQTQAQPQPSNDELISLARTLRDLS